MNILVWDHNATWNGKDWISLIKYLQNSYNKFNFFPQEILKLLMAEVVLVQGHANLQN